MAPGPEALERVAGPNLPWSSTREKELSSKERCSKRTVVPAQASWQGAHMAAKRKRPAAPARSGKRRQPPAAAAGPDAERASGDGLGQELEDALLNILRGRKPGATC